MTTSLVLRPFSAEDAGIVASWFATHVEAIAFAGSEAPWPYTAEALIASVAHPTRRAWTVVADDAPDVVVGHVETVLVTPDSGRLARIALAPERRGQGLSTPMLELALAEARRIGMRSVALFVVPGNEAALAAYARVGFRPSAPDRDHPEYLRLARAL